jgi:hypothetical protein
MVGKMRRGLTGAALALSLMVPSVASAGPGDSGPDNCPRPSYCCLRYWFPRAYQAKACLWGPKMNTYAPDRHPEIEPRFEIYRYQCPFIPTSTAAADR